MQNDVQEREKQYYLEIETCDPSIYKQWSNRTLLHGFYWSNQTFCMDFMGATRRFIWILWEQPDVLYGFYGKFHGSEGDSKFFVKDTTPKTNNNNIMKRKKRTEDELAYFATSSSEPSLLAYTIRTKLSWSGCFQVREFHKKYIT